MNIIYVLKFGASFVLPPGIFIVVFACVAIKLLRRGERSLAATLAAATLALYLLSTSIVAGALARSLESCYIPPAEPAGDVIVMLGGGATKDTPDVEGVGGLCASPANRLLTVARLYRRIRVPILLSGGQVYADSGAEAKIARRVLIGLGVPEGDILAETRSQTTGENARYSAEMLRERGFTRPILVTSAFHMKRAVLNFERAGINVTPYPADYQVNTKEREFHYAYLRPQSDALALNACVLQERLRILVTEIIGY